MKNGKVHCVKCSNNVTPKLWHDNMNSLIFNRSNQHICPVCGVTMYTTGGGLSFIGYAGLGIAGFVCSIAILEGIYRSFGLSKSVAGDLSIITIGAVGLLYLNKRTSVLTRAWLYLKRNNHR